MLKKGLLLGLSFVMLSSCVSKKIYNDLEKKYSDLQAEKSQTDEKDFMRLCRIALLIIFMGLIYTYLGKNFFYFSSNFFEMI